jgi:hypothetical protein
MFKIIQTVHHNDGKDPHKSWYTTETNLRTALDLVEQYNQRNYKSNQDESKIPITYHIEYAADGE